MNVDWLSTAIGMTAELGWCLLIYAGLEWARKHFDRRAASRWLDRNPDRFVISGPGRFELRNIPGSMSWDAIRAEADRRSRTHGTPSTDAA